MSIWPGGQRIGQKRPGRSEPRHRTTVQRGSDEVPIRLPLQGPLGSEQDEPARMARHHKGNNCPYPGGSSSGRSARAAAASPYAQSAIGARRRPHPGPTTLSSSPHPSLNAVPSGNFYDSTPSKPTAPPIGGIRSKYFAPTASDPSSFFPSERNNAEAGPSRQVPERTIGLSRRPRPLGGRKGRTAEQSAIILSDSEEETPEPVQTSKEDEDSDESHVTPTKSLWNANLRRQKRRHPASDHEADELRDDPIQDFPDSQSPNRIPRTKMYGRKSRMLDRNGNAVTTASPANASTRNGAAAATSRRAASKNADSLVSPIVMFKRDGQEDASLEGESLQWRAKVGFVINDEVYHFKQMEQVILPHSSDSAFMTIGFVMKIDDQDRPTCFMVKLDRKRYHLQVQTQVSAIKSEIEKLSKVKVEITAENSVANLMRDLKDRYARQPHQARLSFHKSEKPVEEEKRSRRSAAEIASTATPIDLPAHTFAPDRPRRRLRDSTAEASRASVRLAEQTRPPPQNPDQVICRWPPTGRMEMEVTAGDFYRLNEGEFLNDTLVDFGLRYIAATCLKPPVEAEDDDEIVETNGLDLDSLTKDDIYVFNPFFYKKLSHKPKGRSQPVTQDDPYPEWPSYDSVKKWTSKVDIFSKKFLIIPINENLHWYMAVIYNPDVLMTDPSYLRGSTPEPATRSGPSRPQPKRVTRTAERAAAQDEEEAKEASLNQSEEGPDPLALTDGKDGSPAMEQPEHNEEDGAGDSEKKPAGQSDQPDDADRASSGNLSPTSSKAAHLPTNVKKGFKGQPGLIMTFDSLAGTHGAVASCLNRWLAYEARHKRSVDISWSSTKRPLLYKAVTVPHQPNFSDCGIYCLHNIEVLLENPAAVMAFVLKSMKKKDQLNGEVLDHAQTWQEESALQGRKKWRQILNQLAGRGADDDNPDFDSAVAQAKPADQMEEDGNDEATSSQESACEIIEEEEALAEARASSAAAGSPPPPDSTHDRPPSASPDLPPLLPTNASNPASLFAASARANRSNGPGMTVETPQRAQGAAKGAEKESGAEMKKSIDETAVILPNNRSGSDDSKAVQAGLEMLNIKRQTNDDPRVSFEADSDAPIDDVNPVDHTAPIDGRIKRLPVVNGDDEVDELDEEANIAEASTSANAHTTVSSTNNPSAAAPQRTSLSPAKRKRALMEVSVELTSPVKQLTAEPSPPAKSSTAEAPSRTMHLTREEFDKLTADKSNHAELSAVTRRSEGKARDGDQADQVQRRMLARHRVIDQDVVGPRTALGVSRTLKSPIKTIAPTDAKVDPAQVEKDIDPTAMEHFERIYALQADPSPPSPPRTTSPEASPSTMSRIKSVAKAVLGLGLNVKGTSHRHDPGEPNSARSTAGPILQDATATPDQKGLSTRKRPTPKRRRITAPAEPIEIDDDDDAAK